MSLEKALSARSSRNCELCSTSHDYLYTYLVPPKSETTIETAIHICKTCESQINEEAAMDPNHWRCLNDSMWSEVAAVQVVAWRMLHRLKSEGWPQDLLEMLYLDEDNLEWAKATGEDSTEEKIIHKDSNGVQLQAGDTVVLIKDLNVKGTSFIAKRGTAVRRIGLVHDNPEHIEGKVNDQRIVILTQYVKKTK